MLSPSSIDMGDVIAEFFSNLVTIDRFSYASQNTTIGMLSPDPAWLGTVRSRLAKLSDSTQTWETDKPKIVSDLVLGFANYSTLIKGIAQTSSKFSTNEEWLNVLGVMQQQLQAAKDKAQSASNSFTSHIDAIKNVESLLNDTLTQAWNELAHEEQEMVKIAVEVTQLQDQINSLQSDITGSEISGGKGYFQTTVTIIYRLLSSGAEIPYLSIASLLFTIGKTGYDLIVDNSKISEAFDKLAALGLKASEEAQAAAMTKGVIKIVTNFDIALAATQNKIPPFIHMWSNEHEKVTNVISAIHAGAKPSYMTELVSLEAAAATWGQIATLAQGLTKPPQIGPAVTLPQKPGNAGPRDSSKPLPFG